MNFGGKILKLAIFRYCTLYKYIPIPFLLVIYIRKNNSPISLFICQFYRKGDLEFPNGKSFRNSRSIGRFYKNTRFSKGNFIPNLLNIGLLSMILTFVFCFHLEKTPQNTAFHTTLLVKDKNPDNTDLDVIGILLPHDGPNDNGWSPSKK